ncbi:hypothetical protein NKH14_22575 [Mesorhizobium sp. M1380]|uniref:hypothetical protein n=1 Tax=Mesorhizobium sp. M1380 TaxID=2957093 RepID=UPI0033354E5D
MTYSFYANGYCLGQLVPDGSLLEADPSQEIRSGHLVAVVFKKDGPFKAFSGSLETGGLRGNEFVGGLSGLTAFKRWTI